MNRPMSAAQAAQQNNRDAGGRYQHKTHAEAEVDLVAPAPERTARQNLEELGHRRMLESASLESEMRLGVKATSLIRQEVPEAAYVQIDPKYQSVRLYDANMEALPPNGRAEEYAASKIEPRSVAYHLLRYRTEESAELVVRLDDYARELPSIEARHRRAVSDQIQDRISSRPDTLDQLSEEVASYQNAHRAHEVAAQVASIDSHATWIEYDYDAHPRLYAYDSEGEPVNLGDDDEGFGSALLAEQIGEEAADDVFATLGRREVVDGYEHSTLVKIEDLSAEVNRRRRRLADTMAGLSLDQD